MNPTARLGAFMLAALLILGFFILRIESCSLGGAESRREVKARFPSVAGLIDKSPVRIAGVKVGNVESIGLDRDHALVGLRVDRTVALHQGARAMVRSQGLLGEQYIELDPGPANAPPLPDGTVLTGGSPTGMDTLFDTASDLGNDLKAVSSSLRNSIGGPEGQKHLQEIVANIQELTAQLRAIAADNRAEVRATIHNFNAFSDTLRTEMPKLAEKLNSLASNLDVIVAENRQNVSGSLSNVRDISEKLKVTADNLNAITGKISRGEGSIGKLVNDETTVDNLNSTLKSVESGVASLKDTLGRSGRWNLDIDLKAERLPAISDSRGSFNAQLWTTDRRFYRIGLVKAPFGKRVTTDETITSSFEGSPPQTFTQKTVRATDEFTYNAQVGYKLFPGTIVRAGLIESYGGAGIDQTLIDNKVDATVDVWDFGRDIKPPHIRVQGRYFVTPHLYAFAGYDDPTWKEHRSVLFGAGITWRDEDLKYLLGTAASLSK